METPDISFALQNTPIPAALSLPLFVIIIISLPVSFAETFIAIIDPFHVNLIHPCNIFCFVISFIHLSSSPAAADITQKKTRKNYNKFTRTTTRPEKYNNGGSINRVMFFFCHYFSLQPGHHLSFATEIIIIIGSINIILSIQIRLHFFFLNAFIFISIFIYLYLFFAFSIRIAMHVVVVDVVVVHLHDNKNNNNDKHPTELLKYGNK